MRSLVAALLLLSTIGRADGTTCVVDTPCPFLPRPTSPQTDGILVGWIDVDNQIIIETISDEPLELAGLDLQSSGEHLQPAPDESSAAPFQFRLSNDSKQIALGNLGTGSTLEPSWQTGIHYDLDAVTNLDGNPCLDLTLQGGHLLPIRKDFCSIAGDANLDGIVNFPDFLILAANFGNEDAVWTEGDFDWDRSVRFPDFLSLADNFGTHIDGVDLEPTTAAVPEPTIHWLFLVSLMLAYRSGSIRRSNLGR